MSDDAAGEREKQPLRGALVLVVTAVLPLLFAWCAVREKGARGPGWLWENPDPDYAYLLNSLSLSLGDRVAHPDHPGILLKVIGALSLFVHSLVVGGSDALVDSVLTEPERHLAILSAALIFLQASALFVCGLFVFRTTQRVPFVFLAQAAPFLANELVWQSVRVCPEPLLLVFGLAFTMLCWSSLHHETVPRSFAVAAIVVSGLALGTKLTFAPLVVLPAFWFSRRLVGGILSLGAIGALAMAQNFLVQKNPWGFLQFVGRMATHEDHAGLGAPITLELGEVWAHVTHLTSILFTEEPVVGLVLAASVAALVVSGRKGAIIDALMPRRRRLLAWTLGAEALQLAFILREPQVHYIVPVIALLGLNLLLIADVALHINLSRARLRVASALLMIAVLVSVWRTVLWQVNIGAREEQTQELVTSLSRAKSELRGRGCVLATFYGTSSQEFALSFGDRFADEVWGRALSRLHPGYLFYNMLGGGFESFTAGYDENFLRDFGAGCLVLHGPRKELRPIPIPVKELPMSVPREQVFLRVTLPE